MLPSQRLRDNGPKLSDTRGVPTHVGLKYTLVAGVALAAIATAAQAQSTTFRFNQPAQPLAGQQHAVVVMGSCVVGRFGNRSLVVRLDLLLRIGIVQQAARFVRFERVL